MRKETRKDLETLDQAARRLLAKLERAVEMKKASGRLQGPDEIQRRYVDRAFTGSRKPWQNLHATPDTGEQEAPKDHAGKAASGMFENASECPRSLVETAGKAAKPAVSKFIGDNDNRPAMKGGAR